MSVDVCRSSFASILMQSPEPADLLSSWLVSPEPRDKPCDPPAVEKVEEGPGQFDIWSAIQSQKAKQAAEPLAPPYVHPLMRRSSSLLSQKSLEICTESLGSETGSDGYSSDEIDCSFFSRTEEQESNHGQEQVQQQEGQLEEEQMVLPQRGKELALVNYHCSIGRGTTPRSFPPPLPSISRRDGPCLHMRPHRRDGRLVVEAVPVPAQNYLHAERHGGRLLLSFINTTTSSQELNTKRNISTIVTKKYLEAYEGEAKEEETEAMEQVEKEEVVEEEEEEEVEVVDRGTVVEVKVSTQPQQLSGATKVLRSSLVINKFVGVTPVGNQDKWAEKMAEDEQQQTTQSEHKEKETEQTSNKSAFTGAAVAQQQPRRLASAISTTAAAAAVAATALSATGGAVGDYGRLPQLAAQHASPDKKLLFTSKRSKREELLHSMRCCSQLRLPLFIWEPYCIATSS